MTFFPCFCIFLRSLLRTRFRAFDHRSVDAYLAVKAGYPWCLAKTLLRQHLRELADDGLVDRFDSGEKPLPLEYRLSEMGQAAFAGTHRDVLIFGESFRSMTYRTACSVPPRK